MVQCPACHVTYVANTVFCTECGLYLPPSEGLGTEPLEREQLQWRGESDDASVTDVDLHDARPVTVRLRIESSDRVRELEVALTRPIRLGRIDPMEDIFPEVDLTDDLALKRGVSREHACIFQRGEAIEVEDLGSTNGTLLNGIRMSPYIPQVLKDGDQLQLGKLLIEVSFGHHPLPKARLENGIARGATTPKPTP